MRVLIALDGAAWDRSAPLVEAALAAVGPREVDLATVLPPAPLSLAHPSPVATAAGVAAVVSAQQQQARADEAHAREVLAAAAAACKAAGVAADRITTHVLPAAGGASGVGESLVELARARGYGLVALGSRGLGGFQRTLQSLLGLGSVSDYVLHNVEAPVLVVRPRPAAAHAGAGKPHIAVVAIDASAHSAHALDWAASHLRLGPRDELHVVSVAPPAPRPTLEEEAAAMAVMEAAEFQRACEHNLSAARDIAALAADRVRNSLGGGRPGGEPGAGQPRVLSEALLPEGGASDAGAAVAKYAAARGADLVVVGSRGMGAFKRITMGLLGLGSVSDDLAHSFEGAICVVKSTEAAPQAGGLGELSAAAGEASAAEAATHAPAAAASAKEE